MKKQIRKQVCGVCSGATNYGNLFCSVKCAKAQGAVNESHTNSLKAAGFEQNHNIFTKDGVGMTLERSLHVGLAKAIIQHGHVVAHRRAQA